MEGCADDIEPHRQVSDKVDSDCINGNLNQIRCWFGKDAHYGNREKFTDQNKAQRSAQHSDNSQAEKLFDTMNISCTGIDAAQWL